MDTQEYEYLDLGGLTLYDNQQKERLLKTASKIKLELDENYVLKVHLKNSKGDEIDCEEIDFPLESMVINASSSDNKITLTLQNGSTVDIDVSNLTNGLVNNNQVATVEDLGLARIATIEDLKAGNLDEQEARFINSYALIKWIEYWWNNIASIEKLNYSTNKQTGNKIFKNYTLSIGSGKAEIVNIPFIEDVTTKLIYKTTSSNSQHISYCIVDENNTIIATDILYYGDESLQTEKVFKKSNYPDATLIYLYFDEGGNYFDLGLSYYEYEITLAQINVEEIVGSLKVADKLEYRIEQKRENYSAHTLPFGDEDKIPFISDITIETLGFGGANNPCAFCCILKDNNILNSINITNENNIKIKKSDYPLGTSIVIIRKGNTYWYGNIYFSEYELLNVNDTIDRITELENIKADKNSLTDYVPLTRTIAGLSLDKDIYLSNLQQAIGIAQEESIGLTQIASASDTDSGSSKDMVPSLYNLKNFAFKNGAWLDTEMSDESKNSVQNKVIKEYVDKALEAVTASVTKPLYKIVDELPTEDIDTYSIYIIPNGSAEDKNLHNEYINLDGTQDGWERIGSAQIDLSGYATKQYVDDAILSLQSSLNEISEKIETQN